jgi:hypothetical protein
MPSVYVPPLMSETGNINISKHDITVTLPFPTPACHYFVHGISGKLTKKRLNPKLKIK